MRKILIIMLAVLAAPALAWEQNQTRIGQENHPKVLAQFGGEVQSKALAGYVDGIGRVITRRTAFANQPWTFTVLDTPVVNAFAVPGGYVYVTRGLLALANSEAELAAVIGHEVAHLTRNHVGSRQKTQKDASIGVLAGTLLGAVLDGKDGLRKGIELSSKLASGYVAQHSQQHEFEADETGITYLATAGYDPYAQSKFLRGLAAKHKVEAQIAGKGYNPNRVDFFATHPATGERVRRAAGMAGRMGQGGVSGEDAYLSMIDGMIYGDSARQGFVRGRQFLHPTMRFAFEVPPGYRITNSARQVVAQGPDGGRFVLQHGGSATGDLRGFLANKWLPALRKNHNILEASRPANITLNGLPAARLMAVIERRGKRYMGAFTVVSHGGKFHLLSGLVPGAGPRILAPLSAAADSFRPISQAEAAAAQPYRIAVHTVRPGDTIAGLAALFPGPLKRETFLALNGFSPSDQLFAGDRVKLILQ